MATTSSARFDKRFGSNRSIPYGQVYATLSRLLRDGLVEVDSLEPGAGPERKRYAITGAGPTDIEEWLARPEKPEPYLQNTLYAKVLLALLSGRAAADLPDTQRAEHLRLMRDPTTRKHAATSPTSSSMTTHCCTWRLTSVGSN